MPSCVSTSEVIWRGVLAFVILCLGIVCIVEGGKGNIRFRSLVKLKTNKQLAIALGVFLSGVALLLVLSTVFGWGCPVLLS